VTPDEKEDFWVQTLRAINTMDPRFTKAVVAALVMRHGRLITCENGCCTYPVHTITLEEMKNIVEGYNLGIRPGQEPFTLELMAIPKEIEKNEQHLG
jgi:hypothetical protein